MIIRSQNQKELHNLANIAMIKVIPCFGTPDSNYIVEINSQHTIGTYSTEEKAIKVLDMIVKRYASYSCRYGGDCSQYAVIDMPQDSEV